MVFINVRVKLKFENAIKSQRNSRHLISQKSVLRMTRYKRTYCESKANGKFFEIFIVSVSRRLADIWATFQKGHVPTQTDS
jgi:hypothetical protein